ncbi:hypothetical protein TNCT_696991, partial [Trichonephila clavata]
MLVAGSMKEKKEVCEKVLLEEWKEGEDDSKKGKENEDK